MANDSDEAVLGECCADFYAHPLVVRLLDGILHPGGLAMSMLMAEAMALQESDTVLDIACGNGMTAAFLVQKVGCNIMGIDAGSEMIESATMRASELGLNEKTTFSVGLAGNIPYNDETFTAAYSECAVCTFPEKERAASEISRVLRSGGVLGISDITLSSPDLLDDELKGLFGRVACIAEALPSQGYVDLIEAAGFSLVDSSSHSHLLNDMVKKAAGRARLHRDLVNADSGNTPMHEVLRIIKQIESQVDSGNIGYDLFVFKRD
ncbi:MAG: methyltransferase domain-containing protein [Candidatus Thorarchaeota archaeon]